MAGASARAAREGLPSNTTAPSRAPSVRLSRPPLSAGRSGAGLPSASMLTSCTAAGWGVLGHAASHAAGGAATATSAPAPVCLRS